MSPVSLIEPTKRLVEQAIKTSSGNEGDVNYPSQTQLRIVNLIFRAQIIGLIGLLKFRAKFML